MLEAFNLDILLLYFTKVSADEKPIVDYNCDEFKEV